MATLDVDHLLAPLGETNPCGSDLAYDPAFVALEAAALGRPEQQFGDRLIPAQEPDWPGVHAQALALAQRTRDLRVAVLLVRAGARTDGLAAYTQGLALIAGLLERYWPQVHPMLDADDGLDPTMRLNALGPLVDVAGGLADLRSARVGNGRASIRVRQLELASGKAEAFAGETPLPRDGVLQALQEAQAQSPGSLAALRRLPAEVARIEAALAEKVGSAAAPDLRPLRVLAQNLSGAMQLNGAAGGASMPGATPNPAPASLTRLSDDASINSRDDAIRALERVCEWVEHNEPANPAPLLIRRAQRLMNKNFLEIIRDLVPDGLDQVAKIAGTTAE
jgi:type VI secretion system protein ImpA